MGELTGVRSLDDVLAGGLARGDNVVWVGADGADSAPFVSAFLSVHGPSASGEKVAKRRHVDLAGRPLVLDAGVEVVSREATASMGPDELSELILASDVRAGTRVAITGLDELVARWGSETALKFYSQTCPRLFNRGALAYWTGTRETLGSAVIDGVTRIAQCVFELRPERLRVVKAEGRPARLQGAALKTELLDSVPVVGAAHAGGRVAEGLRRVRRERNLTQTQIAAFAGVTPAAISQAESGRSGLSLDTLLPLCEALGMGVDEFLGTDRHSDPYIARHDRQSPDGRTSALFDDASLGPCASLVRLERDQSARPPFVHKGPELILVASGLVLIDLGETTPVLRAGDALMAVRTPIRRFTNLATASSMLFWVAAAPGFTAGVAPDPQSPI